MVLVWLVVAAHFAFLIYLLSGGFLALRWRRTIGVHAAVVLWGAGAMMLDFWCPLTALERWARVRAGLPPLSSAGFIDHYLTGTVYPAGAAGYVQAGAFLAVLASWILFHTRGRRGPSAGVSPGPIAAAHPRFGTPD